MARDAAGRDVITTTTVYVYGKDQLAWNYRNRFQIELVTDKPEYRPGEKATVLVKTPISGPALVTVERENVRRHFFTKLEGNAPAVRVPLEDVRRAECLRLRDGAARRAGHAEEIQGARVSRRLRATQSRRGPTRSST